MDPLNTYPNVSLNKFILTTPARQMKDKVDPPPVAFELIALIGVVNSAKHVVHRWKIIIINDSNLCSLFAFILLEIPAKSLPKTEHNTIPLYVQPLRTSLEIAAKSILNHISLNANYILYNVIIAVLFRNFFKNKNMFVMAGISLVLGRLRG